MLIGIDASRAVVARPTGTEVYSRRLIQALLELESQQTPVRHVFRLYLRDAPPADAFPGADLRVIPFPRLWTHIRLSWEMTRRPPDALFVPAHVLPPIHPGASLVTIHDLGYLYFPQAHPRLQRLYLDLSTRWNARAAACIVADSKATKADLVARYRTPPEKIVVAYPGYDDTLAPVRDPAVIEAAKARYGIAGDYLLYLGTLQPRKNLARVIEAFASLQSGASLVLAGRRGWLYDDLFDRVRRLGLERRVRFPGYVADEDKAALLSGASAFVFPSLYEGFGLPVLEAQACGCPVITSTTSSLPEVAGDAALLVDPQDTVAIAAAIRRIAADSGLRTTLVERGLANVRRFSWEACARATLDAIEECAKGALATNEKRPLPS
jgi:glycosyltransferase involved in cell wall biosynthesis